jgi:hypothetical protein
MPSITDLQKQAEELRDKLKKALQEEKLDPDDILKMSKKLDEMLNLVSEYYMH